jgi:uncharacterized protein YigE (DUF2233 family)
MTMRPAYALLIALLTLAAPARAAGVSAGPEPCRAVEAQGETFTVCTIDLRRQRLRLFWLQPDGRPYGSLGTLATAQGGRLSFAMNAGMYDKDQAPVGLYVEDGREMKRISTADGPGNFHLKPNGVFWVKGERAGVLDTAHYLRAKLRPDYATQSGPMLVIDGRINPAFVHDSGSLKWRSGVCARTPHNVVFAVSEVPVNFHAFARLFRDELGCRDALFLDGTISQFYLDGVGYTGAPAFMVKPYAGMFAVFEPQ